MPSGIVCSTPFGITEFDAATPNADEHLPRMCSTPFGITEFDAPGHSARLRLITGAQRLSASLSSTRSAGKTTLAPDAVLNAFRHH